MTASRWSIANSLRLTRGTQGAIARAQIRHGRDELCRRELEVALRLAQALERALLKARTRAVAGAVRRRGAA
jgi:hypothetical protein